MMFLEHSALYRLLQREMPEDVYPDGAPSAFYHNADVDSVADGLTKAYANLQRVWINAFPGSADELIMEWEKTIMGDALDASATSDQRKTRYLERLRAARGISIPRIESVVRSVIGESVLFEVVENGCHDGAWVLDESELDISTILNGQNGMNIVPRPDNMNCDYLTETPAGYTRQEWLDYRDDTYRYEVRIYDYTLTADEESLLDRELDRFEPARSDHTIVDGLDPADAVEGDT